MLVALTTERVLVDALAARLVASSTTTKMLGQARPSKVVSVSMSCTCAKTSTIELVFVEHDVDIERGETCQLH